MVKLLAWADGVAATGFGIVSRNILTALHKTGNYDIHHIAINYHGSFVDREVYPWQIVPAKVIDPERDPFGNKLFLRTVNENDYDIIWILNDTYVVHQVAGELKKLLSAKKAQGKKVPKVVYYYPVDCHVVKEASAMLEVADRIITYTDYGIQETLKTLPNLKDKVRKIYHGTNTDVYRPISQKYNAHLKNKWLKVPEDTFVIINVNRNAPRKQLTKTIYAFKEFKKIVPNSILYLHTQGIDRNINLYTALDDLGLSTKHDVVLPVDYSPQNSVPEDVLNEFYNMADLFMTNHLGEGWGLSITEAMAAGTPVLVPNNTCMPELLGNGERGYMYPCRELIFTDNSGYRPMGITDDIVAKMLQIYRLGSKFDNPKVKLARAWTKENNWDVINKQWIDLLEEVMVEPAPSKEDSFTVIGEEA